MAFHVFKLETGMSGVINNDGWAEEGSAQDVQARFPNDTTLQDALMQLGLVGYDRSDFSLPEDQSSSTQDAPSGGSAQRLGRVPKRMRVILHQSHMAAAYRAACCSRA